MAPPCAGPAVVHLIFRPEKMRYERLVNPVSIATDRGQDQRRPRPLSVLTAFHTGSHGITRTRHWKHSRSLRTGEPRRISLLGAVAEKDFHKGRYHQKELLSAAGQAYGEVRRLYAVKRGFLERRAGMTIPSCS